MFGISTLFVKHVELVAAADVAPQAPADTPVQVAPVIKPEVAESAEEVRKDVAAHDRTVEAGRANRRPNPVMKEALAKAGLVTEPAQQRAAVHEPVFQTTPDAVVPSARMKLFNKAFEQASRTLEFDRRWKNGTGYFDGIISNPDACLMMNLSDCEPTEDAERFMKPGEIANATDDHGRRLIIVATRLGPVVVFERYNDGKSDAICMNAPYEVNRTVLGGIGGELTEDHLYRILGDTHNVNLGKAMEELFGFMTTATQQFFEDATIQENAPTMASVVAEQAAVQH